MRNSASAGRVVVVAGIVGIVVVVGLLATGCGSESEALTETSMESPDDEVGNLTPTTDIDITDIDEIRDQLAPETQARLDELGIREVIGEFTTYYTPGESRVINIERIADLTRGVIIEPGEVFSLNNHVGRRTEEKGFVAADGLSPTIGLFPTIGGGISQFTTALFNAGFFAGLEFPEYRAHSFHFERYPYGREATINYGSIDLKIHNITPNGILIWTSYTAGGGGLDEAESIGEPGDLASTTVRLYGTKHFESVEELLPQTITQINNCKRVETYRTRTFPDGQVEADSFFALYQDRLKEPCR